MALAIVQHTNYSSGAGTSTTGAFTLTSTPTVGNILIASFGFYTGVDPVLTPTGWTLVQNNEDDTTAGVVVFSRVVQSGDGTAWSLHALTGADFLAGAMYEISGQASVSVINRVSNSHASTSVTTLATASVTPSVLNCLALAFLSSDGGGSSGTITTGWTINEKPSPSFHSLYAASKNALTADTTTAISATFSALNSGVQVAIILLIAPTSGGAVTSSGFFQMF